MGRNFLIMMGVHVAVIAAAAIALKNHMERPEGSGGGKTAAAEEVRWVNPALERPQPVPDSPAQAVSKPKEEAASDIVYTNAKPVTPPVPAPVPEPPKPPEPKPAPKPVVVAVAPKPKPKPAPVPEVKLRPVTVEKKPEPPKLKPAPAPVPTPKVVSKPAPAPAPAPTLRPAPKPTPAPAPALRAKPIENTATASTVGSTGPTLRAVPISTGVGGMGTGEGTGNGTGNGTGSGRRQFGDIGEYHTRVYEAFHEEWLQPGAIITAGKTYRVKTEIIIARDGKILEANIIQSSGHADLDQSVQLALRRVVKIEPLPDFVQGNSYRVILNFDL